MNTPLIKLACDFKRNISHSRTGRGGYYGVLCGLSHSRTKVATTLGRDLQISLVVGPYTLKVYTQHPHQQLHTKPILDVFGGVESISSVDLITRGRLGGVLVAFSKVERICIML